MTKHGKFRTNKLKEFIPTCLQNLVKTREFSVIFSPDLDLSILVINKSFAVESSEQATPISSYGAV